jgi:nucleoside-diphosphate-sugar epimerase
VAVGFDHVVLGAAGGTGSAVVGELAARGLPVRAVTRSGTGDAPEGVEQLAADVGTTEGAPDGLGAELTQSVSYP